MFVKVKALRRELRTKSFYIIRTGSHFYGTEYEIWADFGPVENNEKKLSIMSNFLGRLFNVFVSIHFCQTKKKNMSQEPGVLSQKGN